MCLETVVSRGHYIGREATKSNTNTPPKKAKISTGYKIFVDYGTGGLFGLFYCQAWIPGRWRKSKKFSWVSTSLARASDIGFHVFPNKKTALRYLSAVDGPLGGSLILKKVECAGLVGVGKGGGVAGFERATVKVYRWLRIIP